MAAPIPVLFSDQYLALNAEQRMKFDMMYQAEAKSPDVGLVCAIFGVFYFYMGRIGLAVAQLLSMCFLIGLVWVIITITKAKAEVNVHNEALAHRLFVTLK
jgi:hypothetical protein